MDRPSARSRRGRRIRRALRATVRAAAVLAGVSLVLAFSFASRTMARLDRLERDYALRLGERLRMHGLVLYVPFDAGIAVNRVTLRPVEGVCAGAVPGRRREARRFDGRKKQGLATDVRWNRFAEGGTVAFWADLGDTGREQRIMWDRAPGINMGLRLLPDRTLEAVYTDAAGEHAIAAPMPPAGRFVPIALVFSNERVALWVDGREAASADVDGRLALPYHFLSFGTSRSHPLVGAIDEAAAWLRPLDPAETAALGASGRAADVRLEPFRTCRVAALRAISSGFRTAARVVDRLLPSAGGPAVLRTDLPELDLFLSKKDERHFIAAHEASLRAGLRTRAATRDRAVMARWGGSDREAFLSLDDAYGPADPGRPEPVARPSFLLHGAPGDFGSRTGVARLVPPERFGAVHPDAPRPLPIGAGCFVRLIVDGEFRGIYVLEPFDALGGAWRALGAREGLRPDHLFFGSLPAAASPAGAPASPEEAEARWRETVSLLRSDARFPWSGAEARWRAERHAARRAALVFGAPRLEAIDLLGGNLSPFYLTENLALAAAGPGVAWRSSDPAAIAADGTVVRPKDGDLPRIVELAGTFPDGSERTFRFRVMPEAPRLPALFLSVGNPVDKGRRTDFTCLRLPAGGGEPEVLLGTAATGGGIRHRGNTSYIRGARRSLSLEFDRPVGWTGAPTPVAHVLLLSGYADCTRLRNALCFDAFAAMRPDAPRGAVPVSWTEVFVNGEYAGVWETCPRLKDVVAAWASPIYKVRTPDGLWSRVSADMLDRRDAVPAGEDAYAPFLRLARLAVARKAEFVAGAAAAFDLDELADMALLLDFTGNADGRITNQYVVRRRSDGRWLALPWDYDKTFLAEKSRGQRLSNPLYDRCRRFLPGFAEREAARWAALRAGPLSDAALERWLDEKSAFLAPFMEEDFRLVPPADFRGTYPQAIESLRGEVLFRARQLDAELGRVP